MNNVADLLGDIKISSDKSIPSQDSKNDMNSYFEGFNDFSDNLAPSAGGGTTSQPASSGLIGGGLSGLEDFDFNMGGSTAP